MTNVNINHEPSKTVEERLQPWIDQGEYVIAIVIGIMAWSAGWVDLMAYESIASPDVLERYSIPYFSLFVVYTLGFGGWFWLLGSLRALKRLKRLIAFIQRTPLIYFAVWTVFIIVIWSMFNFDEWSRLPLVQVASMIYMILFTGLILLTNPDPDVPIQRWRKISIGLVIALIMLELSLQGMATLGILSLNNESGITTPFGRVYQSQEGYVNDSTNSLGWYYPEFRLEEGSRRILLSGDTFVTALQVPIESHMGLQLEAILNDEAAGLTEVIAQGQIGYGSTMFMNPLMSIYIWEPLLPNEIIVFFHLANDFQINDTTVDARPKYELDAEGNPVVVDSNFEYWHDLAHIVISGHDPSNPARTIASQLFTVELLAELLDSLGIKIRRPTFPMAIEQATSEQPFGPATYLFEVDGSDEADESLALAIAQLTQFSDYMAKQDVLVRFVTIPFFPETFYRDNKGKAWETNFADFDILLPEYQLQKAAIDSKIPFLGTGQYFQAIDMSVEDIQQLFLNDGTGHLSIVGHQQFAEAIYACFYDDERALTDDNGCHNDDSVK